MTTPNNLATTTISLCRKFVNSTRCITKLNVYLAHKEWSLKNKL